MSNLPCKNHFAMHSFYTAVHTSHWNRRHNKEQYNKSNLGKSDIKLTKKLE